MVVALLFLFTVLCRFDCWQINAATATIRMYGSYFYCFTDLAAMVTHCLPLRDTKPSWSRRYKGRFCEIGVVAVWAAHCELNLKLEWAINIAAFCSKFNWSCEEKTTTTVVQWSWWTPPTTTGGLRNGGHHLGKWSWRRVVVSFFVATVPTRGLKGGCGVATR